MSISYFMCDKTNSVTLLVNMLQFVFLLLKSCVIYWWNKVTYMEFHTIKNAYRPLVKPR